METLSNILASFDIFQVILSAFPKIFSPIGHAFQTMFATLSDMTGSQFSAHPGLISGTLIFITVYASFTGLSRFRRTKISPLPVADKK